MIGGIGAILLPKFCLCCLGFTCCGVRKDSYASNFQSGVGNVEAGSCFARSQSAGVGGFSCCINLMLFLLGFAGTIAVLYIEFSGKERDPNVRNTTTDGNVTDHIYMYNITSPLPYLT
ncbi:uncharacterized protein NPIL_622041 [Nephila pilipes]|uniref:Uncharacterized protein n=1 Tax=Nephila pilipes TaxID=299642 RepID=A0A8X6UVL1_NEPPI|nr:uncharacterized protein NPIL_622041 [Nephila pilipes]